MKPWMAFLFVLGIDFGLVTLLTLTEKNSLRNLKANFRSKAYFIGDIVGIPLLAAGYAHLLTDIEVSDRWHMKGWWHRLVFIIGCAIPAVQHVVYVNNAKTRELITRRSHWFHSGVFILLFYLLVSVAPTAVAKRKHHGAWYLTLFSGIVYLGTVIWDRLEEAGIIGKQHKEQW